jgi:hypothetical protein
MKKNVSIVIAILGWFAIISQYIIAVGKPEADFWAATETYFSYFTILTNTLVAIYLTIQSVDSWRKNPDLIWNRPGVLTAITVYISVVGLVYQIALRHLYNPTGLSKVGDELFHSIIPVLMVLYWYFYEKKKEVALKTLPLWLIYPFLYLAYTLVHGSLTGFYPYPFVNVAELGMPTVLRNSMVLVVVFSLTSMLFIRLGKKIPFPKE